MPPPAAPAPPGIRNPLASTNPDEQLICEIKRHPIGIMAMYVGTALSIIVLGILIFLIAPNLLSSYDKGRVLAAGGLVFAVISLVALGIAFIAHKVYWGNRWIVTSENITQVKQITLFYKQTSQLSLGNLEDITSEQNGLLAELFHYGVISAETAAATDKFTFIYCPNPTYYTKQILAARERFEERRRQAMGAQAQAGQVQVPPAPAPVAGSFVGSLADTSESINPDRQQ